MVTSRSLTIASSLHYDGCAMNPARTALRRVDTGGLAESTIACPGAFARLTELIPAGTSRLALVHGGHLDDRVWAAQVWHTLRELDHTVHMHRGPPTPTSVAALARDLHTDGIEVIVAIGGGAVLDAAKAAGALLDRADLDSDSVRAACAQPLDAALPRRVIAVPTSAGTGAEVTPFATIWDYDSGRKLSLTGLACVPRAAVLDPCLLDRLPVPMLAGGALDTIAQGAEAAWSTHSTERSKELGLRAVRSATALLDRIAAGQLDLDDLMALQLAGHWSGQAIALANTTACHALSYPLTLRYGIAHGHACGLTFGRLADFNAGVTARDCADPRGADTVRQTLRLIADALSSEPGAIAARLDRFLGEVGLARLAELDIDWATVAADAMSYPRSHNNARRFGGRLTEILTSPVETSPVEGTHACG